MKNIFVCLIFSFFSISSMEKPISKPAGSNIKVPRAILNAIFDGNDVRTITKKINQKISENSELQKFMQSDENVSAVINHISKKTNALPFYIAFYLGNIELLSNQYAKKAITKEQIAALLNDAFMHAEIERMVQLVNHIPSLSTFIFNDVEKTPFLLRALTHSDGLPLVAALINNGADVNKADARGMTPLNYAVQYIRTEALKLLLEYGADVNKKTSIKSPLYFAVKSGFIEAVKILLDAGATISDELFTLAQNNNSTFYKEDIVKILQEKKANPNKRFSGLKIKL